MYEIMHHQYNQLQMRKVPDRINHMRVINIMVIVYILSDLVMKMNQVVVLSAQVPCIKIVLRFEEVHLTFGKVDLGIYVFVGVTYVFILHAYEYSV